MTNDLYLTSKVKKASDATLRSIVAGQVDEALRINVIREINFRAQVDWERAVYLENIALAG